MSLIINGVDIPNTGDIKYNGTSLEKIICNGVEVWKKQTSIDVPPESIYDYITTTGNANSGGYQCPQHPDEIYVYAGVWYCTRSGDNKTNIYVLTPKAPYTKITATIHAHDLLIHHDHDYVSISINGEVICNKNINEDSWGFDVDHICTGSSLTIAVTAGTNGWDSHWHTGLIACIRNIVLST